MNKYIEAMKDLPKGYKREFVIDSDNMIVCDRYGNYKKFVYNIVTKEKTKISQAEFLAMKEKHNATMLETAEGSYKSFAISAREDRIAELKKEAEKIQKQIEKLQAELEILRG